MRHVTALCAAAGIAISALAAATPAQAGYYVIRWDNTGICQIWNEDLRYKPVQQGRRQIGSDLLRRDGCAGKDAAAAPLHALSRGID